MEASSGAAGWHVLECRGTNRITPSTPTVYDVFNLARVAPVSEGVEHGPSSAKRPAGTPPPHSASVFSAPVSLIDLPPSASRVIVAPLPGCVSESGDDDLGDGLREYFGQARLLHVGDIFFVPSSSSHVAGAWLAVIRIDSPAASESLSTAAPRLVACGVVHRERTALLLQGVAHCCRPGQGWGADSNSFIAPVVSMPSPLSRDRTHPAEAGNPSCVVWSPLPPLSAHRRLFGAAGRVSDALATLRAPLGRARGEFPAVLLYSRAGSGKRAAVARASAFHGLSLVEVDAALLSLTVDARRLSGGLAAAAAKEVLELAESAWPCVVLVRHAEALLVGQGAQRAPSVIDPPAAQLVSALAMLKTSLRAAWLAADTDAFADDHAVVLVCSFSVDDVHTIPLIVRDAFTTAACMRNPSSASALRFLQRSLERKFAVDAAARDAVCRAVSGPLSDAPWRTVAALTNYIIEEAMCGSHEVAKATSTSLPPLLLSSISAAMTRLAALNPALADAPSIPDVRYDDVGGADEAKRAIVDMVRMDWWPINKLPPVLALLCNLPSQIDLPLKRPDLFAGDVRPRTGMLLYGPPGAQQAER